MAGASPNTDWVRGSVALDEKGFILTGRDLPPAIDPDRNPLWPGHFRGGLSCSRAACQECSQGGDVRAGSVKRVAAAVGEGAIPGSLVHRALAEL
jgi:thioredoxin reductase (NADPH)